MFKESKDEGLTCVWGEDGEMDESSNREKANVVIHNINHLYANLVTIYFMKVLNVCNSLLRSSREFARNERRSTDLPFYA